MERSLVTALFLVVSTPRPERPSEAAAQRQSFWPWIGQYEAAGVCRHIYARVGRGAAAVFAVDTNEQLHRILNEWADIIPAEFDVYPLVDIEATRKMLADQVAARKA
jgi:muconolactone delta-isomerase